MIKYLFSPQVNIVVFILVFRKMMGTRHMQNKTQIEKVKAGIKASAVILPLLGITWLFGLLAFNSATIAFKYIFAIANSLQGFMIFIFHCLLNKQVRTSKKLKEIVMCYTPRRILANFVHLVPRSTAQVVLLLSCSCP